MNDPLIIEVTDLIDLVAAAVEADTASWAAETQATSDVPIPVEPTTQFYDEG